MEAVFIEDLDDIDKMKELAIMLLSVTRRFIKATVQEHVNRHPLMYLLINNLSHSYKIFAMYSWKRIFPIT